MPLRASTVGQVEAEAVDQAVEALVDAVGTSPSGATMAKSRASRRDAFAIATIRLLRQRVEFALQLAPPVELEHRR